MADVVKVDIDQAALSRAINQGENTKMLLQQRAEQIADSANSLSAGMLTERWYNTEEHEWIGGTEPEFKADVKDSRLGPVGIVYTANYAAQKANYNSNILLKAKG